MNGHSKDDPSLALADADVAATGGKPKKDFNAIRTFRGELRKGIDEQGIPTSDVASLVGVGTNTLNKWLRGDLTPSSPSYEALLNLFPNLPKPRGMRVMKSKPVGRTKAVVTKSKSTPASKPIADNKPAEPKMLVVGLLEFLRVVRRIENAPQGTLQMVVDMLEMGRSIGLSIDDMLGVLQDEGT